MNALCCMECLLCERNCEEEAEQMQDRHPSLHSLQVTAEIEMNPRTTERGLKTQTALCEGRTSTGHKRTPAGVPDPQRGRALENQGEEHPQLPLPDPIGVGASSGCACSPTHLSTWLAGAQDLQDIHLPCGFL